MRLLLDTHIWLWSLGEPRRLARRVQQELKNPHNELWLSPVSAWEALLLIVIISCLLPIRGWLRENRMLAKGLRPLKSPRAGIFVESQGSIRCAGEEYWRGILEYWTPTFWTPPFASFGYAFVSIRQVAISRWFGA